MTDENSSYNPSSLEDLSNSSVLPNLSPQEDEANSQDGEVQSLVYTIPVDHEGSSVYLKGWVQLDTQRPPLVIVHDIGENVRLYKDIGESLCRSGYSVFCFDLRGHGHSGRLLGYIPDFESLVEDLLQVVAWIRFKSDRRKPIVIGQGVGALVTIFFANKYPDYLTHSVLVSPCVTYSKGMSTFYRWLVQIGADMFPKMRIPRQALAKVLPFIESNPSKQEAITLNFVKEVLNAVAIAPQRFSDFSTPSMIIVSQDMDAAELDELKLLAKSNQDLDLNWLEMPSLSRQPLSHKDDYMVVLDPIVAWIENQISTR